MSPKDAIRVIMIWNRSLLLAVLLVFPAILRSQDGSPSQTARTIVPTEAIQPEYQSSGNMAIIDRIPGQVWRIRSVSIGDTLRLLIFPKYHYWEFYRLGSSNRLGYFGKIALDSSGLDADYYPGDIESITYQDGSVRLFLEIQKRNSSNIISIPLDTNNLKKIKSTVLYAQMADTLIDRLPFGNIEMIHQFDGRLFLASNFNRLYMYDVSTESSFTRSYIELNPLLPTLHLTPQDVAKIHEVKGFKRQNGDRLIGLGLPRKGICVLTFDQNWNLTDTIYQYYEFDRTLFPDTVISPNKAWFDTTYYATGDPMRNHKWDWNVCHSIIPYDDGNGKYVVTTDEFTWYPAYKDSTNAWLKGTLEVPDFYKPDPPLDTLSRTFVFYNGQKVTGSPDQPLSYALQENNDHRLSWMRRNHPLHPVTDPNKFQGAFLRIFDRDSIGNNTLSANNGGMILNAYDVGEDPADQIGYFGKRNIPDTSIVAGGGLHEIILSGNRLYLAGYNNGARVLDLRGSDMKLLGYCRTEKYLSNDTSSSDFYLRPDIAMYAKGPYRLIPDRERDDILFANDLYNGVWIYRFFDSTLADTIRHTAFQTRVDLGTVDPSYPRTFDIAGSAVIARDASVRFLDNTTFNFQNFDTLNVLGTLEIGQTTFNAPTEISLSRIRAKDGSTLLLGGCDKLETGTSVMGTCNYPDISVVQMKMRCVQ